MEWTIIQQWTSALELCHFEAWQNRRQFHANSATLHLCKSWRNELRFSLSRILNNETSLKAQSGRRDYRQTPSRDALETINNKVIKEEQRKGEPFTFLEHTCAMLWAWSFRELKAREVNITRGAGLMLVPPGEWFLGFLVPLIVFLREMKLPIVWAFLKALKSNIGTTYSDCPLHHKKVP